MDNKKLKILLVDDDVELREMYADVFKNADYEVFEAGDGIEGLDIASKKLPDIIFTGIVMPRMDGFTMMETLKKTVMTSSIPIVISSHMGREEDHQRANALGAKDFIIRNVTKPIEVLGRISALFEKSKDEYNLEFNPEKLDAINLKKDLSFQERFLCLDCGEGLVLNLKLKSAKERIFEAKFVCLKCGKEA